MKETKEKKHRLKKLFAKLGKYISFSKNTEKKAVRINVVISVLFTAILFLFGTNIFVAIGAAPLLFAALTFKMSLFDEVRALGRFIVLIVLTVISFIIMQTIISCGIFLIPPIKFWMNIILLLGFVSLFWMVTTSIKISVGIVSVFIY
ncbi:MAG: hypothetical protein MJ091_07150, partial [Clostridia bacterium]|nr:hypothetical protein [Clostridia bacterium]